MSIPDHEWFDIRSAARRRDWAEVARRADALGWAIVAKHARRAAAHHDSIVTIVYALRLDLPDGPDPFGEARHA